MQHVSPWIRFLSTIADITILRAVLDVVSFIVPTSILVDKTIVLVSFLGAILITYFLSRLLLRGQTVGMWLFGYTVRKNIKNKRLTWFEEILRFVSQWISVFLLLLPFSYAFFNKKSAHLSDVIVDSSPIAVDFPFGRSMPLQRLIGILLIAGTITVIPIIFQKVPAIDLFARIYKGELARAIVICLVLFSGVLGIISVLGWKWAAHLVAAFYLIMIISAIWSLIDMNAYQKRVSQNLKETLNLAHAQSPSGVSTKMLGSLISDVDNQLQKNLPAATKFGLATNLIPFSYMIYLLFSKRFDGIIKLILSRVRAVAEKVVEKIRMSSEERSK